MLHEVEIFDCLKSNLRLASDRCNKLAWHPRRGFVYNEFRQALENCEGACRQASAWRADTRWLVLGMKFAEAARRAGDWIRQSPSKDARKEVHPLFEKLAALLTAMSKDVEALKTQATLRAGPILPKPLALDRETRPVQVSTGDIILPDGYSEAA